MTLDSCDKTGVMTASGPSLTDEPNGGYSQEVSPVPLPSPFPDVGPRYRLSHKLGQGGMGAVYRADDLQTGHQVAVKVLPLESHPDQFTIQRFQKEARLLSEVQHTNVANLIDSGVHNQTRFLVMELVEGTDLKFVLEQRGQLTEQLALNLVANVAAALGAAHERGIVHRDLKPGNILLSAQPKPDAESRSTPPSFAAAVLALIDAGESPQVKLSDFGLARHVHQGASMEMTKTGVMLGTPYYISPEQCTDKSQITPAADVYSLGATLFEMLTGRPPFKSDDPIKLISLHCFEQAPDVRKLRPELSDGVAELIRRCLQKRADARFADAAHFLAEVDRLRGGESLNRQVHPIVPEPKGRVFEAQWTWDLSGTPAELWPFVSNTERINAAVGLPSVEYVTHCDEHGQKHRIGSFRLGFTRLRWEEFPFEWVEGRRLSVLRQFENGPFEWFVSVVELEPLPRGGSRLTHTVRIATRGLLGRLVAHFEVNIKGRKPLDRIYRRIDDVVSGRIRRTPVTDEFCESPSVSGQLQRKLAAIRSKLSGQGIPPAILEGLLEFLAQAPPQELARIRPRCLAKRLKLNPDDLTSACLIGCHAGLLELHWDILCPTCRVAADVRDSLKSIDEHVHCEACEKSFDVDFSSTVEMIFRVHPDIRHANLKTYCIGGPEHAPHVVAQCRLAAGEQLELDANLDAGTYVIRSAQLPYTLSVVAGSGVGIRRLSATLRASASTSRSYRVEAGRIVLNLRNEYPHPIVIRFERAAMRSDAVTAADALRLPAFREFFPQESLSRERLTQLSTCTLIGLRIANVLDLFTQFGDSRTADLMHDLLSKCRRSLTAQGGVSVKDSDDRLLYSFSNTIDAVTSVTQLAEEYSADYGQTIELRIAVHRGMAMATSLNGKLDYFGRSVIVASRLLDQISVPFAVSAELAADEEFTGQLSQLGYQLRMASEGGEIRLHEAIRIAPGPSVCQRNPQLDSTAVMTFNDIVSPSMISPSTTEMG